MYQPVLWEIQQEAAEKNKPEKKELESKKIKPDKKRAPAPKGKPQVKPEEAKEPARDTSTEQKLAERDLKKYMPPKTEIELAPHAKEMRDEMVAYLKQEKQKKAAAEEKETCADLQPMKVLPRHVSRVP